MRVQFVLGLHVTRSELNVMVVPHNGEGTFKKRFHAIPSDHDTRPTNVGPFSVLFQYPGFSMEYLVCFSFNPLCMPDIAVLVNIFDIRSLGCKDVVIRLETQSDRLCACM